MEMIYIALVLFAIAALIGIYLISFVLQKKETPKAVALAHGGVAAAALVLIIIHTVKTGADIWQIIALFVLTALGGIVLFVRDIMGKTLPKSLAVVHALLAVTSFVFLLVYALNK
jgi:hypothetical protein